MGPLLAVIVTAFCVATALVATVNPASLLPAATVIDFGNVTEVSLLDSVTAKPPVNAFALRLTVPALGLPPVTDDGFTLTRAKDAGDTVSVAVCKTPLRLAVITALVELPTAEVVTVNVPTVCPVGTITFNGTPATKLLLESATLVPAGPATPFKVTVPTDVPPPPMLTGLTLSDCSEAGVTISVADCVVEPTDAVIVAVV
jgi:hypothetical protein